MKYAARSGFLIILFFIITSFDVPSGWYIAGYTPANYEMGIDKGAGKNGGNAATIRSKKKNKSEGWGTLMQDIRPEKFLGKKVKMSAFVKTSELNNKAGLWMRVDKMNSKTPLAFDNMMKRPIKGTTDWTRYEIILDVPAEASNIAFGALLIGSGQLWFDDISFEIAGDAEKSTDLVGEKTMQNAEPVNLNFEK